MSKLGSRSILLRLVYGALLLHAFAYAIGEAEIGRTDTMGLLGSGGGGSQEARKGHVPLDVDGYPVAPPELELEQVHIYVRHGTSLALLRCSSTLKRNPLVGRCYCQANARRSGSAWRGLPLTFRRTGCSAIPLGSSGLPLRVLEGRRK